MPAPYDIRTNLLLKGDEPSILLEEALLHRAMFTCGGEDGAAAKNMARVSEHLIERIHRRYGGAGLFRLILLAMSHDPRKFRWHLDLLEKMLEVEDLQQGATRVPLQTDNDKLPAGPSLSSLRHNCFQPSLARKLYNAGDQFGKITYGLGGPRILVSHPFRGGWGEQYGAYQNTMEIARALVGRGFHGRLLFLDYLKALDFDVSGHRAWLLWFSLIATHSDLVVFVCEEGDSLSESQRIEAEYTSNLTQKKVVALGKDEMLPKSNSETEVPVILCVAAGEGLITSDRIREIEIERMGVFPLLRSYAVPFGDAKQLYVIMEDGRLRACSRDNEVFQYTPHHPFEARARSGGG